MSATRTAARPSRTSPCSSSPSSPPPPAQKAALPLVLYGAAAPRDPALHARRLHGQHGRHQDGPGLRRHPHSGKTCLKVGYTAADNWGGVVWQSPANDWGDQPGGLDLTGAKTLTFWARGAQGGEVVTFLFGLIGKDKTYPDTGDGQAGPGRR